MSAVPRLVCDLIPLILDSNSGHWWTRDLLRLALVSPEWLWFVRRKLYLCPSLHSFRAINLLAHTLQANSSLVSRVPGLVLSPRLDPTVSADDSAALNSLLSLAKLRHLT